MKILFVCHGNICRSPMAAAMCRRLLEDAGLNDVEVASAGTSNEEAGNPMYPMASVMLREHGFAPGEHSAHQMSADDYAAYDYLIGMDNANIQAMMELCGGDPENKMMRLLDIAGEARDIADPWYTNDFHKAYDDVSLGVHALIKKIQEA